MNVLRTLRVSTMDVSKVQIATLNRGLSWPTLCRKINIAVYLTDGQQRFKKGNLNQMFRNIDNFLYFVSVFVCCKINKTLEKFFLNP